MIIEQCNTLALEVKVSKSSREQIRQGPFGHPEPKRLGMQFTEANTWCTDTSDLEQFGPKAFRHQFGTGAELFG